VKPIEYSFRVYKRLNLLADFERYKKFRNHHADVKELAKRK